MPNYSGGLTDYKEEFVQRKHILTGTVVLALATTTTVTDVNVTSSAKIFLQPADAEAAAIPGTNTAAGVYVSSVANGSFVLTHNNHADAQGATFNWLAVQ